MEYFIKNIWPIVKKDCNDICVYLGIVLTIKEITTYIIPKSILQIKPIILLFIIVGCIVIIIKNLPKMEYEFNIKNRDIKIKLKIGDIVKEKNAIIVPTNTTFDTKMENDFISLHSVQGQVQEKYFKNNLTTLDYLIEKELENIDYIELNNRKDSKKKKYEIGTTVEINQNRNRFYFVADSDINERGQTINPSITNITDSLSRLWQYIGENGHVEDIAIPIIGTGRMGIVNSREEILKYIIFSFVASNAMKKIANELIICIRKKDIKKYNIDIKEIVEYIKYTCEYQYEKISRIENGIGIG